MTRPRRTASLTEVIQIKERLDACIKPTHEHDKHGRQFVVYTSDVLNGDHTIAEELGVPVGAVKRVRQELFGILRAPRGQGKVSTAVQARVDVIEYTLSELVQSYNDFVMRVVKHLPVNSDGFTKEELAARHMIQNPFLETEENEND